MGASKASRTGAYPQVEILANQREGPFWCFLRGENPWLKTKEADSEDKIKFDQHSELMLDC